MRFSYPIRTRDLAELLDRALDGFVRRTKTVAVLTAGLRDLTMEVNALARAVGAMAEIQKSHQEVLMHLVNNQNVIIARMRAGAIDTSFPELDRIVVKPGDEATLKRLEAEDKAN